jgi:3-phenylpropionate/trans-cinnamate dioxygenase ferredoxin reductase subunit
VDAIDRQQRQVRLRGGEGLAYDFLLLTTGSEVRKMTVPGSDLAGINYLRTIDDVKRIQPQLKPGTRLVVVGAGYIGLEVAAVAVSLGVDVTVLEMEDRAMKRVVGPQVSQFFEDTHRKAGVDLRCGYLVESFDGDESVSSVRCSGGETFDADVVLIGIGILPRTDLANAAGLACDNGIVVDEQCCSEDPRIFAAGDCTNHPNAVLARRVRLESVHNALEQAKIAAAAICGEPSPEAQTPWFWSDQFDVNLQIVGLSQGYDDIVLRGDPALKSFAAFYLLDGRLLAVDAINRPREFMLAKKLVARGARFDRDELADEGTDFKTLAQRSLDAAPAIRD